MSCFLNNLFAAVFCGKYAVGAVMLAVMVAAFVSVAQAEDAPAAEAAQARYRRHIKTGDYAKALEAAQDLTVAYEGEAGGDAGKAMTGYLLQAICRERLGRAARDAAQRMLAKAEMLSASKQGSAYCALANCSCDLDDHEVAVILATKASALCLKCEEDAVGDLIDRLNVIASKLKAGGRIEDAARVFVATVTAAQDRFQEGDLRRTGQLETVADFYDDQSRHAEAARLREVAWQEVEKAHGPDDLLTAAFIAIAASSQSKMGDHAKAESMARRALGIAVAAKGEQSLEAGTMMDLLASVCVRRGKWPEAEVLSKKAIAAAETACGADAREVCELRRSLVDLYDRQGRCREAEDLVRKSLAVVERQSAAGNREQDEDLIFCVSALAALMPRDGRYDDAESSWLRAIEVAQK